MQASDRDSDASAGETAGENQRFNRLADETSPYLLLHRDNPVDWYPWGEEALRKARQENKPIFLSVGYSTCYWCHVMERESFSDEAVATLLAQSFVSIKVDREERPDLDEIYMAATQVMTGSGGWPNSVWLTPDLEPFYAGTYFPPEDRYGRPSFSTVLRRLAQLWRDEQLRLETSAREVAEQMERVLSGGEPSLDPPPRSVADRSLERLAESYDAENGGFGGTPKFPSPSNYLLLLERLESPGAWESGGVTEEAVRRMLFTSLDAMARGGIYDQLGGGFHRYATDAGWRVPHFEKMLYDNGFLLEIYARAAALGDAPQLSNFQRNGSQVHGSQLHGSQLRRVVEETAAFLARELTGSDGELWSAIDAESEDEDGEHREGAYFAWTLPQLDEVLGEERARRLAPALGFDRPPFFEEHAYVLHQPEPRAELIQQLGLEGEALEAFEAELQRAKAELLAARDRRHRPLTDDKVLTDWSAIAIHGLVTAGHLLDRPELVERGARAADFLLRHLRRDDGLLLHSWRQGPGSHGAYLGDYAFLVRALLALHRSTGEERWLTQAVELAEQQAARLGDSAGGFHTAAAAPDLVVRGKETMDGALPSANSISVLNFLELHRLTGEERWVYLARRTLAAFADLTRRAPHALRLMTVAARRYDLRYGDLQYGDLQQDSSEPGKPTISEGAGEVSPTVNATSTLARQALSVVQPVASFGAAGPWGERPFLLILEIEEGWHVNANPVRLPEASAAQEEIPWVATEVRGVGVEVDSLRYPPGQALETAFAQRPVAVWSGRVTLEGRIRGAAAPGESTEPSPEESGDRFLELRYQACAEDRCLPPVTRRLPIPGLLPGPLPGASARGSEADGESS
ncbi:MAG: thioredoxin domain-containing protein [Acidobacteriota bacterium]